jgi:hypothetical protein
MTAGAVIMAFNTDQVDYVALAAWNSANIRRHLDLPVAVVTDDPGSHASAFDQVIVVTTPETSGQRNLDGTGAVPWHNTNRMCAYELSPWDRTLLLDADLVIASPDLRVCIDSHVELMSHRWAYDVTGRDDFVSMNWFGDFRMPQWWATVMVFERCRRCDVVFDAMRRIRDNWNHYRKIYGITSSLYRNDHALSIALNIENGHTLTTTDIPWSLATMMPDCGLQMLDQDQYRIDYRDSENRARYIMTRGQDLHVMAKPQLEKIVASAT